MSHSGSEPLSYEEAWLPGSDGLNLYTRTYPALQGSKPKAVILFVHGFADHSTRHERDHGRWAAQGITVFTYDQRGFGRTALDGDGAYGRTNARHTFEDMAWWIEYLAKDYAGVPLFLMGYSAGGGYASAFCTKPAWADSVSKLSGVIALSPLLLLTYPPSTFLYNLARVLSKVAPYTTIPAPMPEERFSRDPAVPDVLRKDPLRKAQGTAKGLIDMFTECEKLLKDGRTQWPKDLPLIVLHGTADEVNSCKAATDWFNKLEVEDKTLTLIEGAYHDMVNDIDNVPERVIGKSISWVESHSR